MDRYNYIDNSKLSNFKKIIDDLIKLGKSDHILRIWDPDAEEYMPVTGLVVSEGGTVDLHSDDP